MSIQWDSQSKVLSLSQHNSIEHTIGEEIPAPTIILPSGAAALGTSSIPAREDHTHGLDINAAAPFVSYTPGTSGFTSFGSFTAYYQIIGKRCFLSFQATTPVFSGGVPGIGYPPGFAPINSIETDSQRCVMYYDATGGRSFGSLVLSAYLYLLVDNTAGTYVVGAVPSATIPFTWAAGDYFQFSLNYRFA